MYPLKLLGVTRSPIWSGKRLVTEWNKSGGERIGESWELTVRDDGMCKILNGAYAGEEMSALLSRAHDAIMGESESSDGFPLLIKLLDAGDKLSVQVHPNDEYAARVENDRGKTEMWYIVEADEDAEIICGLCDGVGAEELRSAIESGEVESVLLHRRVRAGECYFIPAGLPHAIGKGILIAEIQQSCDLTYRVYDYERRDQNGRKRELHVKKALDVIRPFSKEEIDAVRFSKASLPLDAGVLADCDYFRVEEIRLEGDARMLDLSRRMGHLLCVGGEGVIHSGGEDYSIKRGDGYLLPASLQSAVLEGEGVFLFTLAK